MYNYKYTQTWFLTSEVRRLVLTFVSTQRENHILEIGSFEGLSSVFWADNLLNHPHSTLTCVDPFLSIPNNDHMALLQHSEEDRFNYNITHCNNTNKITTKKVTSDQFFNSNTKYFNFIYIDGCHEPETIIKDMRNSFKFLTVGGIMWMDDYAGGDGIRIKNAMNSFLNEYNRRYKIIHVGYQLALIKTS